MNALKQGYDYTSVKYIEIVVNFAKYEGNEQSAIIDELHFIETPTLTKNWEMGTLDTGWSNHSTDSITYTETYGSSSCARKFTFENSTELANDGSNKVYAVFSPEVDFGSENGVVAYNCTLSFDIKLSDEFFDNDFEYKHMFELNIVDSSWGNKTPWLDFLPSGAAGFIKENTDNGWIHFSKNLHDIQSLSELNTVGTIRLKFGFWGITPATQASAYLVIDNLSLTPNA